jgi:hypothetical protein
LKDRGYTKYKAEDNLVAIRNLSNRSEVRVK